MPRVSVVKFSFIARFWRFKPEPLLGLSARGWLSIAPKRIESLSTWFMLSEAVASV